MFHDTIIIVASGPSARNFVPPPDIPVIAVNASIRWLTRADYWFTLDPSVDNVRVMCNRIPGVEYYCACPDDIILPYHVKHLNRLVGDGPWSCKYGLSDDPNSINTGNSAYGALGLAKHLGAKRVMLVGVDATQEMKLGGGYCRSLEHLPDLFESALGHGIEIVATSDFCSAIPKVSFDEGIKWLRKIHQIKNAVCVYKTGGDYDLEYVERLVESIRTNSPPDTVISCLSDDPGVTKFCNHIPLEHDWTGWWSKLELFNHFDEAIYFDLDTIIRSDISELYTYRGRFCMLSDFYHPRFPASGVMIWNGDHSHINKDFDMEKTADYQVRSKWGDQGWITRHLGFEPDRLQTLYPGLVASYKSGYSEEPIICFHGTPRPKAVGWKV